MAHEPIKNQQMKFLGKPFLISQQLMHGVYEGFAVLDCQLLPMQTTFFFAVWL